MSRARLRQLTETVFRSCALHASETSQDLFFRAWGEHPFRDTAQEPLSTFAVDVDTASYTLARRTLRAGRLPQKEQIRTEEFLNYFRADQPAPKAGETLALSLESAPSLFSEDPNVDILRVTLRARDVADFERKPLALTVVIDVSGSMDEPNRLPLVKRSLVLLLTQLSYADQVALLSFSTSAKVLSESVSAAQRGTLEDLISRLHPEGGTNIEAGLTQGFEVAARGLVEGATNRVILLSDGVGNIGETDQKRILEQVAAYRQNGIYLNTIGVGMGDLNDDFLEQLADKGDGQCQYFDSAREAEKVLVNDFTKTLEPVARDVKLQVEFDPFQVLSYRQIGYENRAMSAESFRNDALDAGDVNSGHQVTALYEIVRQPGAPSDRPLATARVRFKAPFRAGAQGEEKAALERAKAVETSLSRTDQLPSFQAADWGYRRAVLIAQLAECLRRSIHARPDSMELLLQEIQSLARQRNDLELFELRDLAQLAIPMLQDERERQDPELLTLVDALCKLHYEVARREELRADKDPDQELEALAQTEILELKQSIAGLLRLRAGLDEPYSLPFCGYYGSDDEE